MILETEFNIGDKVFAIIDDEITKVIVKKIDIEISEKQIFTEYHLNWGGNKWATRMPKSVFKTKEDIIKDLK